MDLSFELHDSKRGDMKILFIKLDCSDGEIDFLKRNRLFTKEIYEFDHAHRPRMQVATAITKLTNKLLGFEADHKMENFTMESITVKKLVAGHNLQVYEYQVPDIEDYIEGQLTVLGAQMKRMFEREQKPGRTSSV